MHQCLGVSLNQWITIKFFYVSVYCSFIDVETWILPEELVVTDVVEVSLHSLCRILMYILNKCVMCTIKPCFSSVAQTKPQTQRWWKQVEQRLGKLWLKKVEVSLVQMTGSAKRMCLWTLYHNGGSLCNSDVGNCFTSNWCYNSIQYV